MKKLTELTAEQEAMIIPQRELWLNKLYQNKGIDKELATEQIKWLYNFAVTKSLLLFSWIALLVVKLWRIYLVIGLTSGITSGGLTSGITSGLTSGLTSGITSGITSGLTSGITSGLTSGINT